jgi:tetratricopeptide (TPR) repeat protein/transposase
MAVKDYLNGGKLKEVAAEYSIHYNTLSRWVQVYQQAGEDGVDAILSGKPWNRSPREREERVVRMKEAIPSLTIREAQQKLKQQDLRISVKGIYGIWKRYNMMKRSVNDPYSPFGSLTAESGHALARAQALLNECAEGHCLKKAAIIINNIPVFPREGAAVLRRIPDRCLTPRRRLDKICLEFMVIPMPEFRAKVHTVRTLLEEKKLFYTAIIAGLIEILALHWMNTPQEELKVWSILHKRAGKIHDPVLRFLLNFFYASVHAKTGAMKKAGPYLKKNRDLLRALPHRPFIESHGDLMAFASEYRKAQSFYMRAMQKQHEVIGQSWLRTKLMMIYVLAGDYHKALREARMIKKGALAAVRVNYTVNKGLLYYGLGKFDKAVACVRGTFTHAEKEQFRNMLYAAVLTLASVEQARGEIDEAAMIIKKHLRLVKKYGLKLEQVVLEFLFRGQAPPRQMAGMPIVKLIRKLKRAHDTRRVKDFRNACAYARGKGLIGFFHRCMVFYPAVVLGLMERGYRTDLPRAVLRFPVFNKEVPVYRVKFLGSMRVSRRRKQLKAKFTPKERALLVYIATKINEPGRSVPVRKAYGYFWDGSANPANRLSHVLVRIRNGLGLPAHLLYISSRTMEKRIVNRGFYVSSDYEDFQTMLAEAAALERAGEWDYARRMFRQGFRLMRGEPFKGIYDEWSENMRTTIINHLESALKAFSRSCAQHGVREDAMQIGRYLARILPNRDFSINPEI